MQTFSAENSPSSYNVLIIAGETSGDQIAAKLVRDIHTLNPDMHFFGMGGQNMQKVGVDVLIPCDRLAVVGVLEVVKQFKYIYQAWRTVLALIKKRKPQLIILIDYPGFNLRLAKAAKKRNVKVIYYVSPQLWAWKANRINIIKKYVDKMLVIYPFEQAFYRRQQVAAEFVGNPLVEHAQASMQKEEAIQHFHLNPQHKIIGLLPGSRQGEIKYLLPTLLDCAKLLKERNPQVSFLLPLAPGISWQEINNQVQETGLDIRITKEHFYDVVQICDAAIVASGTATLQVALIGTPMAIIYKLNPLTYLIAKRVVKLPYIGLCNIVAQKLIAREFIQETANPENIVNEISRILEDDIYRFNMVMNMKTLRDDLKASHKPQQAAQAVLALLNKL